MRFDYSKLNKIANNLDDKHVVRVGIFGSKSARKGDGPTNAYIGSIHEFGWPPSGIPPRSFLRWPIAFRATQIAKDAAIGAGKLMLEGKFLMILKRLGLAAENAVQLAFATHGFNRWPPDKVATAERKGSGAPLIDTGQLRRSIASQVVAKQ